ncbi:MAG: oligosaccharide flippase family protein [Bacteroidia bacterium]|nr:oligosaccharide flippase family protein [Bacteroidia bacterium]
MSEGGVKHYLKIFIKGGLAVSLANSTTTFLSLLLLPVFTYYLSPQDYGTVSIVLLIITALTLFCNPGILSSTVRLYHETDQHRERQELIGSAYRFFLFVPLVFLVASLLFGESLFPMIFSDFEFYPYGLLAMILAFFTQAKRLWVALMTLVYKLHITAIYLVIAGVAGILTSVILVIVFKMGAMGKVIGFFPPALFLFVISFLAVRKFSAGHWSVSKIKELLKFGYPLIIAIWSYELLHVADRFIIERMLGVAALGIYVFAYNMAESQRFLIMGIRELWHPVFYENMNRKDYQTISKLLSAFIMLFSLMNMLMILFAKEFILWVINSRYHEAVPIIGIIVVGLFFNGLLIIFSSSLAYKNKFGTISKIAAVASVINIVLNILLIPEIGLLGSAFATLIAYFLYFLIGTLLERRSILTFLNVKILVVSVSFVCASGLVAFFLQSSTISVLEIVFKALFLLSFIVTIFAFRFVSGSEVNYLFSLIKTSVLKKFRI